MTSYVDESGAGVSAVRVLPVTGQPFSVIEAPTSQEDAQTSTGAAAAITATLAAVPGKRTFIAGFVVDGLGATGASVVEVTITGVLGGTMRRKLSIPAGTTAALSAPLAVSFARPIPASADNTAIVVNVPSFGVGNTSSIASVYGFSR